MAKVIHLTVYVDVEQSQGLNVYFTSTTGQTIFKPNQSSLLNGNTYHTSSISNSVFRAIGWLFTAIKLRLLFDLLSDSGFIQCSFEVFESHFINRGMKPELIKWCGASNALSFLISELLYARAIPPTNSPYVMTANHFIKANGESFDNNRLRKNHNKGMSNSRMEIHISNIVKALIKD